MLIYPRWFAAIAFEHWTTRIRATFHVLLATFFSEKSDNPAAVADAAGESGLQLAAPGRAAAFSEASNRKRKLFEYRCKYRLHRVAQKLTSHHRIVYNSC